MASGSSRLTALTVPNVFDASNRTSTHGGTRLPYCTT